ncbi:acyl-CoA dehydrogenase [Klebsiella pneumoniae]|uniref:Acyl-CoA dehydrogenase n=1 Tax=Klebsiella pneumoniae TaxID=573 RepID=A0A377V1T8_KLEPN|nr:acyl-CoA dehydrogenase [Klebsiella pneumoniae]
MEARIAPCRVGILGTSLSAIDAAVAVVARHGVFHTEDDKTPHFSLHPGSGSAGDHPDVTPRRAAGGRFLLPDPVEPLEIATPAALEATIAEGSDALLDRIFELIVKELEYAAPDWSEAIGLRQLTPDSIADAWLPTASPMTPFSGRSAICRRWSAISANTTRCPGAMPFCACMRRLKPWCRSSTTRTAVASARASPGYLSITTPPFRGVHTSAAGPAPGWHSADPDAGRRL